MFQGFLGGSVQPVKFLQEFFVWQIVSLWIGVW